MYFNMYYKSESRSILGTQVQYTMALQTTKNTRVKKQNAKKFTDKKYMYSNVNMINVNTYSVEGQEEIKFLEKQNVRQIVEGSAQY